MKNNNGVGREFMYNLRVIVSFSSNGRMINCYDIYKDFCFIYFNLTA